jgi:LIVCS family branched-chain amino acid:cation transporter
MALFSMFFGAGNLIFPLLVGLRAGTEVSYVVLGLGLSAVLFPLLGLFSMLLYEGDLRSFLARLGPVFAAILLFALYMASALSLPRLVILMYGSVHAFFPALSLLPFSLLICAVIFLFTVRQSRLVDLLGTFLTPFLLLTLAVIILVGIFYGSPSISSHLPPSHHFLEGLKGGYQTMDLLTALLFATIVIPHLRRGTDLLEPFESRRLVRKRMMGASLIASGLLLAVYIGLTLLATHHAALLQALPPEEMLPAIAGSVLGQAGGVIASVAVFLACLTTAISLAAVFANYLQTELLRKKTGPVFPLFLALVVTAMVANLGLGFIIQMVGTVMQVLYPALIVLCLINIGHSLYRVQPIKLPVYAALGLGVMGIIF